VRSVNGASFSVGIWKEGFFAGNSESYLKHAKDCSGNGAALIFYRFLEKNLELGLLY
jgi:hypothetical protein